MQAADVQPPGPIADATFAHEEGDSRTLLLASGSAPMLPWPDRVADLLLAVGLNHDGRVHAVRSGLVVSDLALLPHEGARRVFAVKVCSPGVAARRLIAGQQRAADVSDRYLIFSFFDETRVMVVAEEIEEATLPGIDEQSRTVFAGSVGPSHCVQVTPNQVPVAASPHAVESDTSVRACR
jgi:hypothetical protein